VTAQTGEPDRAIAALEKLLSISYCNALAANVPRTAVLLRLDLMFDPLRNDYAFTVGRRHERARPRSQQARTRLEDIYSLLTTACVSTKNAARKSKTLSWGKFNNFKRRSVIAMGGSVFADVGREAGGLA